MTTTSARRSRATVVLLTALASLLAALALVGVPAGRADAGGPIVGRPPAVYGTVVGAAGLATGGLTVQLRAVAASGQPGAVVNTTTTNDAGQFALTGGDPAQQYFVELVAGPTFQRGWVGGTDPRYFQTYASNADTFPGKATLGEIVATPSFISGQVVDSATGTGVAGVAISFTPFSGSTLYPALTATTGRGGWFRINGLYLEDGHMRINGHAIGYEVGAWGCAWEVVPTALQCQPSIGVWKQPLRIDKLP